MSNGRRRNALTQSQAIRALPSAVRRRLTTLSVVEGAHIRDEIRRH
jgi:hypothetical protein